MSNIKVTRDGYSPFVAGEGEEEGGGRIVRA